MPGITPSTAEDCAPSRRAQAATRCAPAPKPSAVDSTDPFLPLGAGQEALQRGDLGAAMFHLRKALFFDPTLAVAEVGLGLAHQRRGALAEALAHYRSAAALLEQQPSEARVEGTGETVAQLLERSRKAASAVSRGAPRQVIRGLTQGGAP